MNKLFKNLIKDIFKKKIQFFSIITLIIFGIALYSSLMRVINVIDQNTLGYKTSLNQEDARITVKSTITNEEITKLYKKYNVSLIDQKQNDFRKNQAKYKISLQEINNNSIEKLAQKYNFNYELESSKLIDYEQDKTIRILKSPNEINKIMLVEGENIKNDDEIIISERFGALNNLKITDKITIQDQNFKIVGYFRSPAYSLIVPDQLNGAPNTKRDGLAIVSNEKYKQISDLKQRDFYTIKFNDDNIPFNDKINQLRDENNVITIIDAPNNLLLNNFEIRKGFMQGVANTIPLALIIISMLIFLAIIQKQIEENQKQLGVLKALGYSSSKIMLPYPLLPIIIILISFPLGYLAAIPLANLFIETIGRTTQLQPVSSELSILLFSKIMLVMIIFFATLTQIIVYQKIKKPAIKLLQNNLSGKANLTTRLVNKLLSSKLKFTTRLRILNATRSTIKIVAITFLITLVTTISLAALGLFNIFENLETKINNRNFEETIVLDRSYQIDEIKQTNAQYVNTQRVKLKQVNENKINEIVSFNQTTIDPYLFNYRSIDQNNDQGANNLNNGLVINNTMAIVYDIKIGDEITFVIDQKEYKTTVQDINTKETDQINMAITFEKAKELFGFENQGINQIHGNNLVIENSKIKQKKSKSDAIEEVQVSKEESKIIFTIIFTITSMFTMVILNLISAFIVDNNRQNIAMMQILGYNQKQVSKLVLNIYIPFILFAISLGSVLAKIINQEISKMFIKIQKIDMPVENYFYEYIIVGAVIFSLYLTSLAISKKRIQKVDIKEIMS